MSFVLGFVYFIVAKSAVAKTGRSIRLLCVLAADTDSLVAMDLVLRTDAPKIQLSNKNLDKLKSCMHLFKDLKNENRPSPKT